MLASDTPALEGDLASILAKISSIDLYEWNAFCEIQGQALDPASKRALTHLAVETCLQSAFDNPGYSFEGEPLKLYPGLSNAEAALNYDWPLK